MIKQNKLIFYLIGYIIIFGYILINPFYTYAHESNSKKDVDNKSYKIFQQKIKLPKIGTFTISGLNSYLIKHNNIDYLLVISVKTIKNNWLIDTIKLNTKLAEYQNNEFNYDIPLNLYLTQKLELIVYIEQVKDGHLIKEKGNKSLNVEIPYFILVNHKNNNNFYVLEDKKVKINLNSKKPIKFREEIKIKFNQKDLKNIEFLIGFKQTEAGYLKLQNYIKTHN